MIKIKINQKVESVPMQKSTKTKYDCVPILSQLSNDKWLEIECKDKKETGGYAGQLKARKMLVKTRGLKIFAKKPSEN